jgi:hypothetical protein
VNTMTSAHLSGFYPPGFDASGRQRFAISSPSPDMEAVPRAVEVADARALQIAEGLSEAEFLARHSFVLLPHPTAVRD